MDSVWKFVIKKEMSKSCKSVKGQGVCCINHIMAANAYRNRLSSQHNEALRALRKKPALHAEHVRGKHVARTAPHELLRQEIFEVIRFLHFDRNANAVD
jgi:hypothetical protein